jgi:AcrR family transcriptional regulator
MDDDVTRPRRDAAGASAPAPRDGRDARWERHREERRGALVDATIRAIRRHGASVGMDDIAAEAGTSKTVVYRHFDDRAGLYRAVAARIDERVVRDVGAALDAADPVARHPRAVIASMVEAYLALVESDTEVYRFVVNRPLVDRPLPDDPVGGTVAHVTDQLTGLLLGSLRGSTTDPWRARTWAIALVGSVQAVADDWLASARRAPRAHVVSALTDLAWDGLSSGFGPARGTTGTHDDIHDDTHDDTHDDIDAQESGRVR